MEMTQPDPAVQAYFGAPPQFATESPSLISSSQWLNDPHFRDFFARAALRRNHKDYLPTADNAEVGVIINSHLGRDFARVEGMLIEERNKNPQLDEWLERKHLQDLSKETLAAYPKDSLGNLYYRFVTANGYDSALSSAELESGTNIEYFMRAIGFRHDLDHLMAGFGFDYISEQGVSIMSLASYYRHLSPELASYVSLVYTMLIVPLFTRTLLHYPQTMWTVWDCISRGMLIGRTSKPIFMMDYESVMHLPVPEARKILGFQNVVEEDLRDASQIWSEIAKTPFDPRFDEAAG